MTDRNVHHICQISQLWVQVSDQKMSDTIYTPRGNWGGGLINEATVGMFRIDLCLLAFLSVVFIFIFSQKIKDLDMCQNFPMIQELKTTLVKTKILFTQGLLPQTRKKRKKTKLKRHVFHDNGTERYFYVAMWNIVTQFKNTYYT